MIQTQCNTNAEPCQENNRLAGIVYLNTQSPNPRQEPVYSFRKLWSDGSSAPISPARYAEAIKAVEAHGYKNFGLWLNSAPALAWSPTLETFTAAWGEPILRAPCKYSRQNGRYTAHALGTGYLAPTRSRAEVFRLRGQYPLYQGDLLFVPAEILYRWQTQAEKHGRARQASINEWLKTKEPAHQLLGADFRLH